MAKVWSATAYKKDMQKKNNPQSSMTNKTAPAKAKPVAKKARVLKKPVLATDPKALKAYKARTTPKPVAKKTTKSASVSDKQVREAAAKVKSRNAALKKEKQVGLPGGVSEIEYRDKQLKAYNKRKANPTMGDKIRKAYNSIKKKSNAKPTYSQKRKAGITAYKKRTTKK